MTEATYASDYGDVPVSIIEQDDDKAKIALQDDTPPLGDAGEESWVDTDALTVDMEAIEEEFTTDWVNYGDANPEPHGGRFVKWVGDMWKLVETTPATVYKQDATEDEHLVSVKWVEPMDVWVNGNPTEGFTDDMQDILESLHERGGLSGRSPQPTSPEVIENIDYYVADFRDYVHGRTKERDMSEYDDGYKGMVAAFGVTDWGD